MTYESALACREKSRRFLVHVGNMQSVAIGESSRLQHVQNWHADPNDYNFHAHKL